MLETEEEKMMGRRMLGVCVTGYIERILVEFCVGGATLL